MTTTTADFWKRLAIGVVAAWGLGQVGMSNATGGQGGSGRVQPYAENPHYLAWGEQPVFALGATGYHSWTPISRPGEVDFEAQFDRLAAAIDAAGSPHVVGLVRCLPYDPMNHMHDGDVEAVLQPWKRKDDGRFDLREFEPAWEERLRAYLDGALERRIIVVVEVWDDWSITRGPGGQYDPGEGAGWNGHPFNPRNNINYDDSVLPVETSACDAPFYRSLPARDHIEPVLSLQKRYVDHLLGIVAGYPNVLINLSNESRAHLGWSRFWAEWIRERTGERVMIGDMPSTNRRDGGGQCDHAFSPLALATDPRYDHVDVAQAVSGHAFGDAREQALSGGSRLNRYREVMVREGTPRPLICSKDYTRGPGGGRMVLWSRFVGGAAAARFHRLGGDHGQEVIDFQHEAVRYLGAFLGQIPFWKMQPAPERLTEIPEKSGVNLLVEPEGHAVIQLIDGRREGALKVELAGHVWSARWLDPDAEEETHREEVRAEDGTLTLTIPTDASHQIVHLKPLKRDSNEGH